jgi:nucleotidyltransferase/DNA polymerase involved in DNA repair
LQDPAMTKVTEIPGIGKTFEKDLRRIGIATIE